MSRDDAVEQARREHGLGAKAGKRPKKKTPAATQMPPPSTASGGGTAGPTAGGTTAGSGGTTAGSGGTAGSSGPGVSSIGQRLRQTAPNIDPDPDPDPVAEALRRTAMLVQPTWKVDGDWFVCWHPDDPTNEVRLPIAKKPGPFTPTEHIHPVLGQPDMLYAICAAINEDLHSLVEGPTGVAKTTAYRWLGQQLKWNVCTVQMHKDIAAEDLVGEYKPSVSKNGSLILKPAYGTVSKAVIASQDHPTILVFEELNRVGNLQVFASFYSLLDDTRMLTLDQFADAKGQPEVLLPGKLYIGATQNPVDSDRADYIGVQELDPALRRRFGFQPKIGYPPEEIEAEALCRRVKGLQPDQAKKMVAAATRVREDEDLRYPFSFPDMVAWAVALRYYPWEKAAELSVVQKAHPEYHEGIRGLVKLHPTGIVPS